MGQDLRPWPRRFGVNLSWISLNCPTPLRRRRTWCAICCARIQKTDLQPKSRWDIPGCQELTSTLMCFMNWRRRGWGVVWQEEGTADHVLLNYFYILHIQSQMHGLTYGHTTCFYFSDKNLKTLSSWCWICSDLSERQSTLSGKLEIKVSTCKDQINFWIFFEKMSSTFFLLKVLVQFYIVFHFCKEKLQQLFHRTYFC